MLNISKYLYPPLTLDYIQDFLLDKGVVVNQPEEKCLTFILNRIEWYLFYDGCRLRITTSFALSDDLDMHAIQKALLAANEELYAVKCFTDSVPVQQEDNTSQEIQMQKELVFTFEGFCLARLDFKFLYRFSTHALIKAIEYNLDFYKKCQEESRQYKDKATPIGFMHSRSNEERHVPSGSQTSYRRIGFV